MRQKLLGYWTKWGRNYYDPRYAANTSVQRLDQHLWLAELIGTNRQTIKERSWGSIPDILESTWVLLCWHPEQVWQDCRLGWQFCQAPIKAESEQFHFNPVIIIELVIKSKLFYKKGAKCYHDWPRGHLQRDSHILSNTKSKTSWKIIISKKYSNRVSR